jgi:hypothetical protein
MNIMNKHIYQLLILVIFCVFGFTNVMGQAPSAAAPTPPGRSETKVISIFSNAYSDVAGTNYSPYWNQSTIVSTVNIAGNPTLKFTNFNYQGFELGNVVNALPMTHLHLDVWTSNETSLTIAPISQSATNQEVTLTPIKLNSWNSYDISLASVKTKWLTVSDVFQFILKGAGGHTVYIDNIYFYNDMVGEDTAGPDTFTATAGLVTFNSVEILMNGKDNSGAVFYELNSADFSAELSGASDQQKSISFYDLNPNKTYTFTLTAKDYAGNSSPINPIKVSVTTKATPAPAPIPPARVSSDVISIYGDAYPANDGWTNFFANWKQITEGSEIKLDNNPTLMYRKFNYQGIELGTDVNALPMTHLHLDVWTPDETTLEISPVSRSKTNTNYILKPLLLNTWNSFDIPLSSVSNKWLSVADIYQFMLKGAGGHTIYIDNIYFYNNSGITDAEAPTAFTVTPGAITFNSIELKLKANDNSGAVKYQIYDGTNTHNVNGISGISKSFTIYALNGGTTYNFSVTAKDPVGNKASNSPFKLSAKTFDAIAAPIPMAAAADVISIFSNKYPNIAGCNYNPNWSQATVFAIGDINGNEFISLSNLNYQGMEFGSHVNASAMKYLHVDVWSPNETAFQVALISPGKEKLVTLTPLTMNSWNSFDVPLSSFTGVALNDLFQFKFIGSGGKIVYLDNLYFSKSAVTSVPVSNDQETFSLFPNPVQNLFTIKSNSEIKVLVISNIFGQVLTKVIVNAKTSTIDMSGFSSGNYFISVETKDGKLLNEKVIKL